MPFLPHFLFDATSKSQWTALQRPQRGKKANGTKHAQNESTGRENFPLHSLKTLLTSGPQAAQRIRTKQGILHLCI